MVGWCDGAGQTFSAGASYSLDYNRARLFGHFHSHLSFLSSCSLTLGDLYPDLKGISEEEILEEMREQGVIHVQKIKVRRDDALKDTNTFVFSFNTSVLQKQLKVAFLHVKARYRLKYCLKGPLNSKQPTKAFLHVSVDPYIPNPLRRYVCQVFEHHENKCHREEICTNWSG